MDEIILTVSMPNYNHAKYLPQRIPSLLKALPTNSELIIVDDGSTDQSVQIIEEFAKHDQRLIFIRKKQNQGVMSALDTILQKARGKYISFQSSDDYILPNFFQELLTVAEAYPHFGIYCSNFGFSYGDLDQEMKTAQWSLLSEKVDSLTLFPAENIVTVFRKVGFWVPGHSSIISREWVEKLGRFHPILRQHADWFLIHAVALMAGVVYLPKNLAIFRMDDQSFTSRERKKKKALFEIHMEYFKILSGKGAQELRARFRASNLLREAIIWRVFSLLIRPQYWDFLFSFATGVIERKWRKFWKTMNRQNGT